MRPAKKIKLLLFDANIVLKLHELGMLGKIVEACDVTLASSVVEESQFVDRDGVKDYVELDALIQAKAINVVTVSIADIQAFRLRFKTTYFEKLDPGEAESRAFMFKSADEYRIVSADTIVWKVLGANGRREQGLSRKRARQDSNL